MVNIVPYLNFPNAKKAIELYQKIFDAKIVSHQPFTKEMSQGRFKDDYDFSQSTMHAELNILGQKLYLADSLSTLSPKGMIDILIEPDSEEQTKLIFDKAKELGSKINMNLEKTFWGAYYANFRDPLGITWQLNYQLPVPTSSVDREKIKEETKKEEISSKKKVKKAISSTKKTNKKNLSKKKPHKSKKKT